uniref:NADH-ubiquinone oxidoreductase chain 2 n=1 Tax=Platypalpus longicornis TaxID=1446203 RepID=A0A7G7CDG9_9MUSC|nr:NADH dehydrogenase subunit 2 [Platypalpus longicornis]
MLNNSSKILFFLIVIMGTLITISANSWIGAWIGLEINLLAFIPLMNNSTNLMSTESSLKYFLTQAMASAMLLFCIILMMIKFNFFQHNNSIFLNLAIASTLMLKSGTAPFHFWFPEVMEGLNWISALTLMTWQKIAPLMLISYLNIKTFFFMFIILSAIIGSIGGLNQTSIKKIMAFSSINHLGWMLSAMIFSNSLWMTYFLFYSFLSSSLILFFYLFQVNHINQLFSMFFFSKTIKFSLFMNFLSLGGLPPFLGFLPKWLVINALVMKNQMFLLTILVMCALVTLFFYMRMCYTTLMLNFYELNWHYSMYSNNQLTNIYLIFSFISSLGLIMLTPFYIFMM